MEGNILIVDDSPIDKKIIRQILEKRLQGINLFEADNGLDIADKLIHNNISVCVLDIMMPEKNGFEVLKELREDKDLRNIPIIVCTGICDSQAIETALTLGAFDYFSKPLSEEAMKISLPLKVKNAIELKKRNDDIIYLSYHDKLTGLYNRRFFEEKLNQLNLERNLPLSLIVGDVNGLKLTNDAFGHVAGDNILITIASIIKKSCRAYDIVARTGGDEFLVILPNTTRAEAEDIASKITARCSTQKEEPIRPSISLGCSTKVQVDQGSNELFKLAEDRMYRNKLIESKRMRDSILSSLRKILEARFDDTESHSDRLLVLSQTLGISLGLSNDQQNNLLHLALLHDIGFTGIPDSIMKKNDNLSETELSILKTHCEIGYRIACSSSDLSHIANDILSHHEHWDGTGYPQGLEGEAIPLNSRIIFILDSYDAMVNGSPFQIVISKKDAMDFIKSYAGIRFDPNIADVFLKIIADDPVL